MKEVVFLLFIFILLAVSPMIVDCLQRGLVNGNC